MLKTGDQDLSSQKVSIIAISHQYLLLCFHKIIGVVKVKTLWKNGNEGCNWKPITLFAHRFSEKNFKRLFLPKRKTLEEKMRQASVPEPKSIIDKSFFFAVAFFIAYFGNVLALSYSLVGKTTTISIKIKSSRTSRLCRWKI